MKGRGERKRIARRGEWNRIIRHTKEGEE